MTYTHPFIYEVHGDRHGFLPLGMKIREHYLKWVETDDTVHVENAVPYMARLVGWTWKKIFHKRPLDQDILDPVVYKMIFKYVDKKLPTEYSLAKWLKVLAHRCLVRAAYKTYIPEEGDASIRTFTYHPFSSPADVEHAIFIKEMKELLLDHIEHRTRFEESVRKACRYLADTLMNEKLPSPLILKNKFGIPYSEQSFYLDFTTVVLRNELYKLRSSLPHLYGQEKTPYIAVFGDDDEFEETYPEEEEDARLRDL